MNRSQTLGAWMNLCGDNSDVRRAQVLGGQVRWGKWRYDPEDRAISHDSGYTIDLGRMHDSASVLDAIAQVGGKAWCTAADVGHFVRAVDELLFLQATTCGGGRDKSFDAALALQRPPGARKARTEVA